MIALIILLRVATLLLGAVLFGGTVLVIIALVFAGIVSDHSYDAIEEATHD